MTRFAPNRIVSTARNVFFVFVVLAFAAPAALAHDVLLGFDLWSTPPGGGVNDFGDTSPTAPGNVPPIPADLFFPGSQPFTGVMDYVGNPLGSFLGQPTGPADMIVERQSSATLPTIPSSGTIPIEIVALQLQSTSPITVNPGGTQWDVRVQLDPASPSVGSMTITHNWDQGGTYSSSLRLCPRYDFFEVNPPFRVARLDYCIDVDPLGQDVSVFGQRNWTHDTLPPVVSPLSGPNFFLPGRTIRFGPLPATDPVETPPPLIPALGVLGRSLAASLFLIAAGIALRPTLVGRAIAL